MAMLMYIHLCKVLTDIFDDKNYFYISTEPQINLRLNSNVKYFVSILSNLAEIFCFMHQYVLSIIFKFKTEKKMFSKLNYQECVLITNKQKRGTIFCVCSHTRFKIQIQN